MKALLLAFSLVFLTSAEIPAVFSPAANGQTRLQPNTPAWEAMWKKCQAAVLRKYGTLLPDRSGIVIDLQRAVALIDACMANGGRVL